MSKGDFNQKLADALRKPRKKFNSVEQRHHYHQAVKHYGAWKHASKKRDFGLAEQHIAAFKHHSQAGKLTNWHKDRLQHESNHIPPAQSPDIVPFKKKKKGEILVKSRRMP